MLEYRPRVAGRKVGLLEEIMEDKPSDGEEFITWFHRWLALVSDCEIARGKQIDDDIKCAVILRRCSVTLRDHLILQNGADRFLTLRDLVFTYVTMNRVMPRSQMQVPQQSQGVRHVEDATSQLVAGTWDDKGKGKGKGKGSYSPYF